ncbi:hypothetical protein [Azospirillum sp. B506]|uniref:hypothetical protein n=1 Tax=Azospirillum sp. B506 TaxID=137721 RepID=UPI00034CE38B|nr:hypothetical protein [Azospirillum sp. B506]
MTGGHAEPERRRRHERKQAREDRQPTDADLKNSPQIGGSKGARAAGLTPDDLELAQGETTFEGDVENQTNDKGGVDKPIRDGPPLRPRQA